MKSKEYLYSRLEELFLSFPGISIEYEFRNNSKTHVIQIIPREIFEENESLGLAQLKIEDEFEGLFQDEEVLFMTENELIQIEQPEFSFSSKDIEVKYTEEWSHYICNLGDFNDFMLFDENWKPASYEVHANEPDPGWPSGILSQIKRITKKENSLKSAEFFL